MVDIPVTENDAVITVAATIAAQTVFAFDFLIYEKSHLKAIFTELATGIETDLVYPTDFSVTAIDLPGGSDITLLAIITAVGDTVTIYRDIPVERLADYQASGDFFAETINRELDLQTMRMQELRRDINLSVRVGVGGDATIPLPAPEANKVLIGNAAADGYDNGPTADEITNAQSYAIAAAASETNASASENKAADWAEEAEDVEVEAGEYSAHHWALKALAAGPYTHPNHTGDVTSVGDGPQTIADEAVTLAKMADMATASYLGRITAATGVPEVLSKADVQDDLGGTGVGDLAQVQGSGLLDPSILPTSGSAWEYVEDTYDFAVDGAITEVESAAFADGYEYGFLVQAVTANASPRALTMKVYKETDAAYHNIGITVASTTTGSSDDVWSWVELSFSRVVNLEKVALARGNGHANCVVGTDDFVLIDPDGGAGRHQQIIWHLATAQKIGKARFAIITFSGGKILMYRRPI